MSVSIIRECHIPHTTVHFYLPFDIHIYNFCIPNVAKKNLYFKSLLLSVKMFSAYLVHLLFRFEFLGFYSIVIEVAILL